MLSLKQALSRTKALYGDYFNVTVHIEKTLGTPYIGNSYKIHLWTTSNNYIEYSGYSHKSFEECFIKLADKVPPKE